MGHSQSMFLDFQELLVESKDLGGLGPGLQNQPFAGMLAHFLQVASLGHVAHNTEQSYGSQAGNKTRKALDFSLLQVRLIVTLMQLDFAVFWGIVPRRFTP
jgi:hypothetical protein